jgi:hypothetical protein
MCVGKSFGVFFFLQSEVADGFHASIFVIRAVLQCDLSSFVRACVFLWKIRCREGDVARLMAL